MRIIANVHMFYPKHCCGSEACLLHIFKYLVSKGHQCRVILQRYDGPMYVYEGIEVFPASGSLDAFRWSELMVTHLDFSQFSILIAHQIKRPLLHLIHNDIEYSSITNANRGQFIAYNSKWVQDKIDYKHPSIVIHPPCDTELYNVNPASPKDNEFITLVSQNERKGGYMFYEIAKAMPEKKFMAVRGSYDNPGEKKLTQDEILGLLSTLPNVTVIPNSPDIQAVYRQTRLLLMPSDYESWGRTATEAMCNGIPVIVTPTDGLKENCGEAAEYVGSPLKAKEPGDAAVDIGTVDQWVAAIKKFDNPKHYAKKSLLCRNRAKQLDPLRELQALEEFIINARF